jgi:hypothetical protein
VWCVSKTRASDLERVDVEVYCVWWCCWESRRVRTPGAGRFGSACFQPAPTHLLHEPTNQRTGMSPPFKITSVHLVPLPPLPTLLNYRLNVFEATRQFSSLVPHQTSGAVQSMPRRINDGIGTCLSQDAFVIELIHDGDEHAATVPND